jgi:O-antigen/teichoic acid export membrane protein
MSQPQAAGTAGRAGLAEVARGSALNLAGAVISAAATLATTVIVTRHFSRSVAGAFVTATSLFLIVEAIAGLGAANGAVYFIARLRPQRAAGRSAARQGQSPEAVARPASQDSQPPEGGGPPTDGRGAGRQRTAVGQPGGGDRRVAAILRAAVRPVLVASVLSAGLMLIFAEPLARLLAEGPLTRGGAAPGPAADAVRALAVAVPFAALADTFLGASRGFRNMLPTVVVDRITRPVAQVAGLIVAVAIGRAALLAPLWSLPYLPASLAAWLWFRHTRLRPQPPAEPASALRPGRVPQSPPTAPPVPWAYPAHPGSPPADHWTLFADPSPPSAGLRDHPVQPLASHRQGTRPARHVLQEIPPALAVLLALSRPVPPRSPSAGPPAPSRRAPSPGWTAPVPPPRSGTGSFGSPAIPRPPLPPALATPGPPMPPAPSTWAPAAPPVAPDVPREPITQPLWFPGEPGLPWMGPPPPAELTAPGPPWAPADPPLFPGPAWPEPADQDRRAAHPSGSDLAAADGDDHSAAGFWAFTAPRALAGVAQIVLQRLDIVLVAVISGPAQAAVYAAATRFLVAGQLANAALIQAAQPQLSHLFGIGDRAAAGAVYQATTAWLIVLTWPLYLLSALFGPQLLAVFGPSYRDGATVVVILALAMLLATACGQVDLVLITAGRSRWSLFNGLVAVVVNVAVDVALIPRAGITGAAVGWAAALAVSNLIPLVQVAWVARVHPFGRGPAAAIAVTTVAFGAVPLAVREALGPGLAAGLAGVAAGTLLAAAGLWCCRGALRLAVLPGLSAAARSPGDKGKDERKRSRPGPSIQSWSR